MLVGKRVGYLNTTSTETSTTQTVEFLDTGTQLYFRPFVSSEGEVRMELKPQVSAAEIRNITDAKGAAVTIPDEVTQELVTNVDLLRRAQPSQTLLKAILHTKHLMNQEVLSIARDMVRRVIEQLLEKLSGKVLTAEQIRVVRAVETLEQSGSSEARQLLETLAKGAPGALPTREAQAALDRLNRLRSSAR